MLVELWDLMDIPIEDRRKWNHITTLSSSSVNEVSRQGSLALEVIEQVTQPFSLLGISYAPQFFYLSYYVFFFFKNFNRILILD